MSVVSDVEIRLRADIARLQQDMTAARRSVDTALDGMSASAQALKGVLGGIAAGLSVGAFVSFVKNSIDAADALNDMSVRTKVAIEDLAGLAYAAKLGDTSLEGVASSISKLGQNIGKDSAKFRELGITATEPVEAFKQLADIFKDIKDPQQRAAFGAEALGKSWQEAAVLLDGGAAGIEALMARGKELSGVTEQVAADAGKFNDGLDTLGFTAQGVGTRIAAGLLPMLNVLVDDFTATGKGADKAASAVTVLSGAFKALYAVGVVIVEMFTTLGKAAGAAAAITVAALSGDFKGAVTIYKELASDVADGWVGGAKKIAAAWSATSTEVKASGEAASDTAAATAAKVAGFLNSSEVKGARDKAAASTQAAVAKEQAAYAGLIASIKEKMAVDQLEILGGEALTVAAKSRIKLDEELAAGKVVLTAKHVEEAHALLEVADTLEKSAKGLAAYKAMQKALTDQTEKAVQAAIDEADKNEELAKTFGMTKAAIEQLELARMQDQLAQRASTGLTLDEIDALEKLIAAKKRSAAAVGAVDALEKQKKAADDAAASQVAFWKSIDDTAHQTFVSILNGSKDTATRLKDTFKNVFFDWLYQMTIKKWIINIGTSSSGGLVDGISSALGGSSSGAAASSGGSGLGGILGGASNIFSIGKTIYSGFSAGLTSSIGSSITSLGTALGSEAVAAFGAGISGGALGATTASAASGYAGTAAASAGAGAAGAIPVIGWIITAMMTANGLYKQGWDATNGTLSETGKVLGSGVLALNSVLKKIGLSSSAANIFSGQATISKLFGRKNPEIESQGLKGTLTATGTTDAQNYVNILEKGGWFRSDKRYTQTAAASKETDTLIDSTMQAIVAGVKSFGAAIGIETKNLDSYTKAFDLKLTGVAETDNAALAKLFGDIGDELAVSLVPNLKDFKQESETLSVTLQRLATDYTNLDTALASIGTTFGAVGISSLEARERFIAAGGGLDKLATDLGYFQQNFLTASEQLAPVQKQLADALKALGVAGLTTNDQFKTYLLGLDKTTEAGATMFAQLLALAPAFNEITRATEAQTKAAADLAAQQLAANETLLRGNVSSALDAIKTAIDARKGELQTAFESVMSGLADQIDKWTGKITDLQSLQSLLSGAKVTSGQNAVSREVAQAQIEAALAIAKSSGVLPSADSIKDAISAVTADSSNQFATLIEYQRSQARAQNSIAGLAGITDNQLTIAERTLLALQDQKTATQAAYDRQISSLDALVAASDRAAQIALGTYQATLSVGASIATLSAAIAALNMGATTSNPTGTGLTLDALYQAVLGRAPDAAGAAYWAKIFGDSIDSAEYANFVQGAQAELAMRGNSGALYAPVRTSSADTAIVTLNAKLDTMQTAMSNTAAATQQLARQFDQVSANGNALLTEAAK